MRLVDTTMFFSRQGGGVRRYLLAKRAWLAGHRDIRHTLIVPGAADHDDCQGMLTLGSPRLPWSSGYYLPVRMDRWRQRLCRLAPDLIEVGDPYQLAWAALRARREQRIPVVGFFHSDLVRLVGSRLGRWTKPCIAGYLARLYRQFDLVLAPSQVMVERLHDLGVERVALQPLGVDTLKFHPGRRDPDLRRMLGLGARTRLLIFAGRDAREKNIPVLLQAMKRLGKAYHLLLVGGSRRQLPDNVTGLSYVGSEARLARLMASCDAFVHAGDQETYGLVVVEAMACGLPVVGVAAGGVGELVDAGVGMLAPRCQPQSLADAVVALFERNPETLGRRGRERVESRYDWNRIFPVLLGHYEHLTGISVATSDAPLCAVS